VYLALTLDNATLLREPTGSHMTLDHVDLLDDDASFIGVHTEDLTTLAFIFASDDFDKIISADMPRPRSFLLHGYSTSGASETIFIYLLARSSRATGPKIRVPIGSPASLISTAAFPSKRM
jgi:hypothetical protein